MNKNEHIHDDAKEGLSLKIREYAIKAAAKQSR